MQIYCSDSVTALCWRFRELQTRGCNMLDIVHAFQHACMLRNHKLQFEDAEHENTLNICPAVGRPERLEEPLKFQDAKGGGRGKKSSSRFWIPRLTRPLSEHGMLQAIRGQFSSDRHTPHDTGLEHSDDMQCFMSQTLATTPSTLTWGR